jgi:hypothetical protein
LRTVARTEVINQAERHAGRLPGSRRVAVCFADLVGFTREGEELPLDELGAITGRLEQLTLETVAQPVRFVKSIGDAVMLVSSDAPSVLDAALTLVDAAGAQHSGLPELRAGVATGPALSRAGDWFGRPVNLASRITSVARPGTVLAAEKWQRCSATRGAPTASSSPPQVTASSKESRNRSICTVCAALRSRSPETAQEIGVAASAALPSAPARGRQSEPRACFLGRMRARRRRSKPPGSRRSRTVVVTGSGQVAICDGARWRLTGVERSNEN